MQREGNIIIHDQPYEVVLATEEQIDVNQAVENARVFAQVADSLSEQVRSGRPDLTVDLNGPKDLADHLGKKALKAAQYRRYVSNVEFLCAEEVFAARKANPDLV